MEQNQEGGLEAERGQVSAWLARFSVLVMDDSVLDADTVRERLSVVEDLKSSLSQVGTCSVALDPFADDELIKTFAMAKSQLPTIERDLRAKLGKLKPGDPTGTPDLDALQERLSETAAKIELGVSPLEKYGAELELEPVPPNYAAGTGMLIFGLGWNSFTLFHAFAMIGGTWKAFGPGALALLAFYSIFFLVGFAMLYGAFVAMSEERVAFAGSRVTVTRKLWGMTFTKTSELDVATPAVIGIASDSDTGNKTKKPGIVLTTVSGRPLSVGYSATEGRRESMLKRVNGYLAAQVDRAA